MKAFLPLFLWSAAFSTAQDAAPTALVDRASQEFRARNFGAAERDFRELTKIEPSSLFAHTYLGHALFRHEKFAEAIGSYESARDLEGEGKKLSESDHRVLVDQLVMSYGIGGQMAKAHKLLDEAIGKDPGYPLNYYEK